jgi:hypothetical protein
LAAPGHADLNALPGRRRRLLTPGLRDEQPEYRHRDGNLDSLPHQC